MSLELDDGPSKSFRMAAGFAPALSGYAGILSEIRERSHCVEFAGRPHAIILYSQLLRARRTVSINVLSASMTAFGQEKFE
jgi:hypothetical protein